MSPVLEDRIRDLFAATTQRAPTANDPATRAIARARVIQRRRWTVASAAAVLLLGTSVYGLGARRGDGDGVSPTGMLPNGAPVEATGEVPAEGDRGSSGRPTGIDLDLRAGDRIWTSGGPVLTLPGVGEVTRAYRVPAGWIYGGTEGVRLLLVEDGTTKALIGRGDEWALDPAGARIAFTADGRLHVAAVTVRGLAVIAGAPVAAPARPVGFVGGTVLVRDGDTGGYALFDPAAPVEPAFTTRVLSVLGPRADGATVALVREDGGDRVCLARLEAVAAELRIGATGGCAAGLTPEGDATARLSTDGGHLYQADDGVLRLIDVDGLLGDRPDIVDCAARPDPPAVWVSADTLLAGADGVAVTCRADGTRGTVAVPEEAGTGWQYVPRLGPPPGSRTE